jgi:hypothetical protein
VEGTQIEARDEQCAKAELHRNESREPNSNVTAERELHSKKQLAQTCWTEEGMQIVERDEH